jgi:hypothetical protein
MKKIILISLLYILIHSILAQEHGPIIDVTYSLEKTRSVTEFLASYKLEGCDTPSKGLEVAARYITDAFSRYGLDPAPDLGNYFLPVKMISKDRIKA